MPLVASSIRGHSDVIGQFENGIRFDLSRPETFLDAIILLYKNPALRAEMGERNIAEAKRYAVESSVSKMAAIYGELITEREKSGGGIRL